MKFKTLACAVKKAIRKARHAVVAAWADPRRVGQALRQRVNLPTFQRLYCEEDKRQHFGVSLLLFVACLLPLVWLHAFWSGLALAVGVTLLIGLGKEIWDHFYGSGFCWLDMAANVAGIGLGAVVATAVALAVTG